VKFRALAIDYDGTIALDGVLNPDVRAAIGEARARGLVVVLVTGRILSDLLRVAGRLDFLDAIVTENGAVLSFPNGSSRLIGQPPPADFLEELRRRGIEFTFGQCVVEADAIVAQQILAVIREMELPLLLLFNRGRLMVLPQGVSKGVGLRAALSALRLSVHNAIGIGDAENDHDLLATCEIGRRFVGQRDAQTKCGPSSRRQRPASSRRLLAADDQRTEIAARADGALQADAGHIRGWPAG